MAAKRKSSPGTVRRRTTSRNLLRAFFDQSADSIFIINKKGRFVEVNPHACALLGYARKELLSRSISDAVPTGDLERDPLAFERMQSGETVLKRRRMRKKNGKMVHVELSTRMLSNGNFLGIARVPAKSAVAEQSLQERDAQLASIFRVAPVGIGLVINHVIQEANEYLCQMTGYPREELVGQPSRILSPGDEDFAFMGNEKDQRIGDRSTGVVETRWKRKDGSILHVILSAAPLHPDDLSRGATFTALDISSRKQTSDLLSEKDAELDRYFTNALDLMCIADTDGYLRRLNTRWEVTLGYPIEELEGKRFLDLVHPDDLEATVQAIAKLDAQKQVLNFRNRYRCRDGSYRWLEWRSFPAGKLIYATARDISAQREAEESLRYERQLLRTLVDSIPDLVYAKDKGCRKTLANPADVHAMGAKSEAEVLGKDDFAFYSKELAEEFYAEDQSVMRTGQPIISKEECVQDENGEKRFLLTTKQPLRDAAGNIVGLAGIGHDITERKRIEEELREKEAFRHAVFENSRLPIVVMEASTRRFIECNPAAVKVYGFASRAETLGKTPYDVSAPVQYDGTPSRTNIDFNISKALAEGAVVFEWRHMRPDGTMWDAEVHLVSFQSDQRRLLQFSLHDITERKRAEQALRESEERLRLTLDAASIVVWECTKDGRLHEIGPVDELFDKAGGQFHTSLPDLYGSIVPEDRERVAAEIQAALRGEKGYFVECRVAHGDDSIHWIEAQGTLLRDEEGEPQRLLGIARDITGRKQAEDDLRENMRRLQTVVTGAPIVLYSFDRNGIFTLSEGRGLTGLGLTPGEIVGRSVFEVYGDQPTAIAALRRALAGETFTLELSFSAGGTFEASHTAIRDEAGNYAGTIGVLVDITERKRAEEAVRNSEANLQLAFEAARVGDWTWNIVNGEILWSARCKALYGLSADTEITYERFLECVHPEDRERVDRALRIAVETRGDYDVEKRVLWPDGSMHWNSSRGRVFCDDAGTPVRLVGVTLEITDRKRAEEALLKSEEKYLKAFNSSPDSISLSDIDTGEFLEVNSGFERMFGHRREEILGKSAYTLDVYANPADRNRVIELLRRNGEVQNFELDGRRKSGERFPGLLSVETMELGGKQLMITTVRDITDRIKAERALKESEERFRLFMDHFPGLAYMKDGAGRILFANEGFRTLLGISPEEIIGKSNAEAFPPQFAAPITRDDMEVLTTGENKQVEEHLQDRIWSTYKFILPKVGGSPLLGGFTLDITERKRAEDALASLLQRHNLATQAAEIGVWDWDIPNDRLVWDDKMYGLYGIRPDAFEGAYAAWINGVHPGDQAMCDDAIQQALHGRKEYDIEFRVMWPDKSQHIIKAFGQVLCDPVGKPVRMTGVNYDITDRKRAEQALQESEAKFRAAFENAPMGMSMIRPDGTYIDVNPALCRMFGYSKQELLSGAISMVTHPDDIERGNQWIRKMLSGDQSEPEFEKRYIHSDGHIVWGLVRAEWIKDEAGKPTMSVVHVLDITGRKSAEMALKESEQRYRLLFETNPHPMWVNDQETLAFLTVNDAAVATYGFSQDEFLKMTIEDIRAAEDMHRPDDAARKPVVGGIEQSGVWRHRKKDHTLIDVEIISHPLTFKNRSAELVLANDITERRRAEEKIRKLNEELESRVKERTLQLESANKELEAFAYSVSHDLRAPLRAIDGYSRILLEDYYNSLDNEGKRVCNVVRTETQRMGQLVDDLLTFSRLSRSHAETTTIHMADLVDSVLNEILSAESRSRIDVLVETIPDATGDPNLIRQVWTNLLSNAVKFSSKHPRPRIEVRGRGVGSQIEYSIRDNGAGFDMKYAGKLFGVFQRLHSAREFEGTGVGLAIVQRIVHRHGGQIWAEGEVDQGATFHFTLPTASA